MLRLVLALCLLSSSAFGATGEISFDASGADGSTGASGEDAGDIQLNVAYADSAKTQVALTGQIVHHGRVTNISQTVALASLKQISITALGGDGGAGYSGRDGGDGYDGRNGWDGCPPGDGESGGNGGDGTNGGDGGNGGRGGQIHVTADGSQTELLLFVKMRSAPGAGGAGGRGGSGGRGGRGGRGGDNTCKDAQGHPTNGPDGRPGRDGYSGRDGASGASGRSGLSGSTSFDVRDGGATHSYPRAFALQLTGVKTLDENEDTILEPGEPVHLLQLVVSNNGPMPTPTGQALNLALRDSANLKLVKAPAIALTDVLPGGASKMLTFAKGDVVLQSKDDAKIIGQKAVLSERVSINNVNLDTANDAGFVFHWPVGVNAAADGQRAYFGSPLAMKFNLHNVSSKDVGPSGVQAADVQFTWASTNVPGTDVTVTLADGRTFTLGQPYDVKDFTINAKSTLPLPLQVKVANTKNFLTASGKLKINVILPSFASDGSDMVDTAATSEFLALDLRPYAVNRHIDFTKRTTCNFPDSNSGLEIPVMAAELFKDKGSDKMGIRYFKDGMKSPNYAVDAWDFAVYTDLIKSNDPALVLGFLNNMVAKLTAQGDSFWMFTGCFQYNH